MALVGTFSVIVSTDRSFSEGWPAVDGGVALAEHGDELLVLGDPAADVVPAPLPRRQLDTPALLLLDDVHRPAADMSPVFDDVVHLLG